MLGFWIKKQGFAQAGYYGGHEKPSAFGGKGNSHLKANHLPQGKFERKSDEFPRQITV